MSTNPSLPRHPLPLSALCTALATAVAPSAAGAESLPNPLEEVVVTSSRVPMPLREVAQSISVIERAQIEQLGYNSLAEVLRTQPSVAVSNLGGAGAVTSLRIRGEDGYRTLVLLDGIDISDSSGPQVAPRFGQLLSSGIQRVEILRGPQGLMYGADAGGVVNITTLVPTDGLGGEVSAEGGRYGTSQFAAAVGGGSDAGDFSLWGADYRTDGFNARSTDTVLQDDDGYRNRTGNLRLGYDVTDNLRLQAVGRAVDGRHGYDGCYTVDSFEPTDRCRDRYRQEAGRLSADYSMGSLTHQLAWNLSDTDHRFRSEGLRSFRAQGEIERMAYLGSYHAAEELTLVYGVERESQSMDDGSVDQSRHQDGYYAEYQQGIARRLYITAGARHDDNDDFGSHTSYRLSGAWLAPFGASELKLKATWGTGFRAPSLYEIAYNNDFAYPPASQVQLKEEKSEGYDLGVAWLAPSGLYLEAVWFDQQIEDEIYFDLTDYSGYLQSPGNTDSRGVELIAALPLLESLALTANYTFNDTGTADGTSRPYRPEHQANLGLTWRPVAGGLVLGASWRLARDAQDVDGSRLDDYQLLDLNASYQLSPYLQLYGRLENALDEDYQEIPTYNTPGRAGYAGLRYSF